MNKIGFVRRK